ncbi:uncharacterized protein TNCV_2821631 [Trichonephila clavipes]|uniref:Gag-like protein n=1 Tax=Trichonephila clavipes TaxID=2585209 RepID=A0A8X6WG78_TRICX|nr:uncharacterized protein TNCV_2821631 [Trichonephila clavipes]
MVSWEYLWPTLRCRRVAGMSLLLSIGWWYLSSESPKRHCCRVSAADKGCLVYPLDPHPDAVSLYSGCTLGDEPKSIKRLRSGDLLIETISALQTKSFLLAKTFLNSPVTVSPHKSLNTCMGVISEPNLLNTPESEILEGFSDQGVIQRFGHSQTSCRGQQTCSRCACVGHTSTDCSLEPKCINCSQPHSADSKLCPRWKSEKQIQEIKTNKNISYLEARKLIPLQQSQTYAQATISSKQSATTQTDENITKIKCPPLNLLQPLRKPNISPNTPVVTISSSTQAQLLPSISSIAATNSEPQPPIPTSNDVSSTNEMFTRIESSSSIIPTSSSKSVIQTPSDSNIEQDAKKISKARARKRKKQLLKKMNDAMIEIKMAPHRRRKPAPEEYTTDEEDMITYDVEEDEIEPHPDLVEKDGKQYWKGSLLLIPTRSRK